jgi:hypothetical protein
MLVHLFAAVAVSHGDYPAGGKGDWCASPIVGHHIARNAHGCKRDAGLSVCLLNYWDILFKQGIGCSVLLIQGFDFEGDSCRSSGVHRRCVEVLQ